MLGIVVSVTIIALFVALSMAAFVHAPLEQSRKEFEGNRAIAESVVKQADTKEFVVQQKEIVQQRQIVPEPVKPVAAQINNYDFEKLSKVLIFIVGGVFSIISLKFLIRFFNYYKTTRKFKKNTKKTQLLVEQLKTIFDNEKDFLLITDSIEHQLKMNDLLLKMDDSKHYGLELEIADDYLYESYNFINEKLIGNLK